MLGVGYRSSAVGVSGMPAAHCFRRRGRDAKCMDLILSVLTESGSFISFVNGLAYFVLGLSVALEISRASEHELAGHLPMLAAHGFVASVANWLRVGILTQQQLAPEIDTLFLEVVRWLCLVVGALILLRFATELVASIGGRYRWFRWALPFLSALFVLALAPALAGTQSSPREWLSSGDVYSRYLLFFPGLALSAFGFWTQGRRFLSMELRGTARDSLGASLAFGVKAVLSGLIAVPVFGPSPLTPVMTLVLRVTRMLATLAIAFFVVRVLRVFEIERQRRLEAATEQRFQAQQEALEAQRRMHAEVELWAGRLEELVNSMAVAMSNPTRLQEVLDTTLAKVLELTGFEGGDILLVREGEPEPQLTARNGLPEEVQRCRMCVRLGECAGEGIHATEQAAVVRDLLSDPRLAQSPCREAGFRLLVSVPLVYGGDRFGMMNLFGRSEQVPPADELGVLSAIGQQIAVAIENTRLYEQAQSIAALEERERLGRELHDGLAQVLGYVHLKSYGVAELLASGQLDEARTELAEMQRVARETQRDVRESILGLRTTIIPGTGVISTLAEYLHRFSDQCGIAARLIVAADAQIELAPVVEIQLLRIVQEALANIRKHAQANRAWVKVEVEGEQAVITVNDDGQGFDLAGANKPGHFGLQTMKERAESVGGELRVETEPESGTAITVRLPLARRGGQ